jgi:hypothetical protein
MQLFLICVVLLCFLRLIRPFFFSSLHQLSGETNFTRAFW